MNRHPWTQEELQKHSVDPRQFIDFRQSTLPNGMRIVEAFNSSGLSFTLLPDRGLDIWSASYNGIPLTWISQGSPFPADSGLGWLRGFNGGLLTTCGLTHVGPPETDDLTGEVRDLHGRFTFAHAGDLSRLHSHENPYTLELTALLSESRLFGEQLRLRRTYSISLGIPSIHIWDEVTNIGDESSPLMLLYHINVGFPLVGEGAQLVTPAAEVLPRTETAHSGLSRWSEYDSAVPNYAEQVFFHHLKAPPSEDMQMVDILLHRRDLGIALTWNASTMPYFTQWKNIRQGTYVSGIEPGNCIPEGRNAARKTGRLQMLEPGETRTFHCQIQIVDGAAQIRRHIALIEKMRETGTPIPGCQLDEYKV